MSDTANLGVPAKRLVFIDNLRWSAISMVVVIHAAVTYSGVGSWYVRDRVHTSRPAIIALATYQSLQHAAAMGLLFGIAGYFASSALERRSVRNFLVERSYRLGLPLLLYTFVIGPLTEYYIARSWGSRPGVTLWNGWLARAENGQIFSGSGPLWFCLVLLAFSLVFAVVESVWPRRGDINRAGLPGPLSFTLFTLAMTTLTFLLGAVTPGVDTILNVVVHDFPQYPLMFIAGVLAQRGNWLLRFPRHYGPIGAMGGLVVGLVYWFVLLELGGAFRGQLAAFGGGWHWQALAMDLWRSAMCLSLCIGLITLYRDHFNRQGRIARFLTRNAFGVYLFHPPILIAVTVALKEWPVESLLKFVIAGVVSVVATFLFVGFVARRTPMLQAIL